MLGTTKSAVTILATQATLLLLVTSPKLCGSPQLSLAVPELPVTTLGVNTPSVNTTNKEVILSELIQPPENLSSKKTSFLSFEQLTTAMISEDH